MSLPSLKWRHRRENVEMLFVMSCTEPGRRPVTTNCLFFLFWERNLIERSRRPFLRRVSETPKYQLATQFFYRRDLCPDRITLYAEALIQLSTLFMK